MCVMNTTDYECMFYIYIPQYLFIFNTCTYLHAITVDTQIPESSLTAYSFLCYYIHLYLFMRAVRYIAHFSKTFMYRLESTEFS